MRTPSGSPPPYSACPPPPSASLLAAARTRSHPEVASASSCAPPGRHAARARRPRSRTSSISSPHAPGTGAPVQFLLNPAHLQFTPAAPPPPPPARASPPPQPHSALRPAPALAVGLSSEALPRYRSSAKSASAPALPLAPPVYLYPARRMSFDSDDERADEGVIYTSWDGKVARSGSSVSLRARVFGLAGAGKPRDAHKTITTAPGVLGAGETETESEDVPRHLPTSRIVPASPPLIPPNTLRRLTPLLFEFSRLLSIVPALFGALYNIYHIIYPPAHGPLRIDYIVSVLWCILTGAQCLRLTTGLLVRWRVYYTPLPTLIRLLALQAICWPATHFTLTLLGHTQRPVICWAAVATTTSCSRAVQMWVTSNLVLAPAPAGDGASTPGGTHSHAHGHAHSHGHAHLHGRGSRRGSRSTLDAALALAGAAGPGAPADVDVDGGGAPATARRSGRRWDWRRVGVQCALPAGAVYVVMAWAEALRREFAGC